MGGMGLKLTPVLVRHLLGLLGSSGLVAGTSELIATLNSHNRRYSPPQSAHSPLPPTTPHPPTYLYIHTCHL